MNKKIIAAAIAATMAAPVAMAEDSVTVYGKVRQSLDFTDYSSNDGSHKDDSININDKSSRIGFKGSEDLGNGLKAVFQMEFGIGISSSHGNPVLDGERSEFSGSNTFSARNAFVGLSGGFGTVLVGRHDHPVKMSTGKFDIFGDTAADNGNTYQTGADFRADGTLAYVSPSFSGLTILAAVVPAEGNARVSSVTEQDTNDGIADAYSIAAMYSNAGLDVTLGYEEGDKCMDGVVAALNAVSTGLGTANCTAAAGSDYEQLRAGIGYTMDAFHVNLVYTEIDKIYDSWKLAGKYTMGNNAIKLQYWDMDFDNTTFAPADMSADGWDIGLEHNFSKRTQAQLIYSTSDMSESVSGYSEDLDVFSIQLNHNF